VDNRFAGRICLSNNTGERGAAIYTLIATAKLNGVDPQARLADVLRSIADHPASHSCASRSPGIGSTEQPLPHASALVSKYRIDCLNIEIDLALSEVARVIEAG
jgi:hypothetical protein